MSLKDDANKVLGKSNLIETLKQFGSIVFTGSYQYDLMTSQDIDLYLIVDSPNKSLVKNIVDTFIDQGFWNRIKYGDFLNFEYPKDQEFLEKSFYIGLKSGNGNNEWNVDIWVVTQDQESRLDYPWLRNITNEQKKQILEMKSNKKTLGLTSFEIYKKVLTLGS